MKKLLALLLLCPLFAWAQQFNAISYTNFRVPVSSSLTTIAEISPLAPTQRIFFTDALTGANFNAFQIQGKANVNDAWSVLYSTNYTTPTGILIGTSGDLAALAASSEGWFILDARGLAGIRIQASSAGAAVSNVYISGY